MSRFAILISLVVVVSLAISADATRRHNRLHHGPHRHGGRHHRHHENDYNEEEGGDDSNVGGTIQKGGRGFIKRGLKAIVSKITGSKSKTAPDYKLPKLDSNSKNQNLPAGEEQATDTEINDGPPPTPPMNLYDAPSVQPDKPAEEKKKKDPAGDIGFDKDIVDMLVSFNSEGILKGANMDAGVGQIQPEVVPTKIFMKSKEGDLVIFIIKVQIGKTSYAHVKISVPTYDYMPDTPSSVLLGVVPGRAETEELDASIFH